MLNLVGCDAAKTFSDLPTFPNLEELTIKQCPLKKFEIVEEMKSLKRLDLRGTAIRESPSSAIRYLTNLAQLDLSECKKLKHVGYNIFESRHLQLLNLSLCINLVTFPTKSEFSTESATLQDKQYAPLFVDLRACDKSCRNCRISARTRSSRRERLPKIEKNFKIDRQFGR
ncbi:hypothetical protein ACLB2K_030709 [Fragaria x ananassa]